MKVLLQDTQTKLFYAGPGRWVKERAEAFDFERIDRAAQAYDTENYPFAEILVEEQGTSVRPAASEAGLTLSDPKVM